MEVMFTVEFLGGIGEAKVTTRRAGVGVIKRMKFTISGTDKVTLTPGVYSVIVAGISAPEGTKFTISASTVPPTPESIPAGKINKAYDLEIEEINA